MKRYNNQNILIDKKSNKRYYSTSDLPNISEDEENIYIITVKGDRLDILANDYYKDSTKWVIIALANGIGKGTLYVEPGLQIRIPKEPLKIEKEF